MIAGSPKERLSYTIFFIVGLLFFTLVAYRAYHLSMTFDECSTALILNDSYLSIMFAPQSFQTANNHVLNTILMKLSIALFGATTFALRLPNVLLYILYFIASVIISRRLLPKFWMQLVCVLLLNLMNYPLDFFSLGRGYGMAMSFELMSIAMLICYIEGKQISKIYLCFLFAALAVYANFSWLNFYIAIWMVYNVILYLKIKNWRIYFSVCWKENIAPVFFSLLLTFFCFAPIRFLQQKDEFKWGVSNIYDSMLLLAKNFLYTNNDDYGIIFLVFVLLSWIIGTIILLKVLRAQSNFSASILYLVTILLVPTIMILLNVVQHYLLGVMYIEGRKALLYFSFIPLLFSVLIGQLYSHKKMLAHSLVLLSVLLISFQFYYRIGLNFVREWWFDENTKEVANYVKSHPIKGYPLMVVTWYFTSSLEHYMLEQSKKEGQLIYKFGYISDTAAIGYYYAMSDDIRLVPPNYKPIYRLGWDRILLQRDTNYYTDLKKHVVDSLKTVHTTFSDDQMSVLADTILKQRRSSIDWTTIPLSKTIVEKN